MKAALEFPRRIWRGIMYGHHDIDPGLPQHFSRTIRTLFTSHFASSRSFTYTQRTTSHGTTGTVRTTTGDPNVQTQRPVSLPQSAQCGWTHRLPQFPRSEKLSPSPFVPFRRTASALWQLNSYMHVSQRSIGYPFFPMLSSYVKRGPPVILNNFSRFPVNSMYRVQRNEVYKVCIDWGEHSQLVGPTWIFNPAIIIFQECHWTIYPAWRSRILPVVVSSRSGP